MILFTRLDRLSRNVLDSNLLVKKFEKMSVSIVSISEDEVQEANSESELDILDKKLKSTKQKIKRLKDLYIDSVIDKREFDKRYTALNGDYTVLLEKHEQLAMETKKGAMSALKRGTAIELYNSMDRKQKQRFIYFIRKQLRYNLYISVCICFVCTVTVLKCITDRLCRLCTDIKM